MSSCDLHRYCGHLCIWESGLCFVIVHGYLDLFFQICACKMICKSDNFNAIDLKAMIGSFWKTDLY